MNNTRQGNPTPPIGDSPLSPPRPRHRVALVATGVLGLLWLVLTLGSEWLAPGLGGLLERGEVGLGLDVSLGERALEDSP